MKYHGQHGKPQQAVKTQEDAKFNAFPPSRSRTLRVLTERKQRKGRPTSMGRYRAIVRRATSPYMPRKAYGTAQISGTRPLQEMFFIGLASFLMIKSV